MRWEERLAGQMREIWLAARPDRTAICFQLRDEAADRDGTLLTSQTAVVLELDRVGARIDRHFVEPAFRPECSWDEEGALWLTAVLGGEVRTDARPRVAGDGVWALRLGSAPRFVRLYDGQATSHTPVPSGFVVSRFRESLAFVRARSSGCPELVQIRTDDT